MSKKVSESLFMRAARREKTEGTPIWFMRQAGRVLAEYREIRKTATLLDICRKPELCAEVTMQPVRRFNVDAAIMFADIMLPLMGVGVDLELVDNVGPVIRSPIKDMAGLEVLRAIEPEQDIPFVLETIRLVREELNGTIPLIGFSGAPFTLAAYLVEGKPSRDFVATKTMMYSAPKVWHALMERLTSIMIPYLQAQAAAGVDALQLFDSWVGALSPADYEEYVRPYSQRIFAALASSGLPFIHFGTNTATLLDQMKHDGGSIIGVDWRIPLDVAWKKIGYDRGIQGNMDQMALLGPPDFIAASAEKVLRQANGRPGHIFNLGHGLYPETPVDNILRLIDVVREHRLSDDARAVA